VTIRGSVFFHCRQFEADTRQRVQQLFAERTVMAPSTPESCLPPPVLVGAWCTAIFERLRCSGVSDIVISPGSRSTPLAVAALRSQKFRCHSIIDERSAAFFALGLIRGAQAPVALVCTSGTAGAHYFPALIEASYDGLPLVVLSADRPEELQNCGAPQTIAQGNLFG
jgi:2-succinyl-5-enolpyruvyl-6-hydroxy-3-cyclohexene-1-carboxylate synthase